MKLRIGSRKSALALRQTQLVAERIKECFPDCEIEIVTMSTKGDEHLDKSLIKIGGKGVFTKELEEAIVRGEIDLAVHSAKDLPLEMTEGLEVYSCLERENPLDVLVTRKNRQLKDCQWIGTSSLRRALQIREMNPHIEILDLRGNVQTRLKKLEEGLYDGIVLASAGIRRMEEQLDNFMEQLCFCPFDIEEFIPAACQGILALQVKKGTHREIVDALLDDQTQEAFLAERAFLEELNAGCNAPCGIYVRREGKSVRMSAMYAKDGKRIKKSEVLCEASQSVEMAKKIARYLYSGKVFLVGAGPGNMDLLSVKGLEKIKEADCIVYDSLIDPSLLNQARLEAELIYVGKRAGAHYRKQPEISALLVEKAMEGKMVVRLKGGDPFIFGRGGEEILKLRENDIEFEVISGVSSSYAVPAAAGIPVTHRGLSSSFHVITGHESEQKTRESLDFSVLAKLEGTLVFLMGLKSLPRIAHQLMIAGKPKNTPAAVISKGCTREQKKVIGNLENIADLAREVEAPAITVVGDVVSLSGEMDWSWKEEMVKPLFGKKILLTGSRQMVQKQREVFKRQGAQTIELSLIETVQHPSKAFFDALKDIEKYSWLVFTSVNGVRAFFDCIQGEDEEGQLYLDQRRLAKMRFAVIGEGTRKCLREYGYMEDMMPNTFTGRALAREWVPTLEENDQVLLVRAEVAGKEIVDVLRESGISYVDATIYSTYVDRRREEELQRILPDVDYVTMASASCARAFSKMRGNIPYHAKLISIGPVTSRACIECGVQVDATAKYYTAEGLCEQICELEK